ncbi:MAG: sigma-70 family RNA polymerase sigma factor [Schleiferiaceae bacterium]|jgi:RNA polymerase sigma-70 factor (ECF subfamily)|nr:sigma-70 family RNA polymerase sigma factor [Schleiferiaceae bacterium]
MADLKKLITACIKNDRRAQKQFYDSYFHVLMSVCYRYQKNYDDAVYLLNTGFIKIIKSLDQFDATKPIEPWLKTIMVNVAIDEFRKTKKYQELTVFADDEKWNKIYNDHCEIDANAELDTSDYWELVREIPDPEGTVFNLFVIEDFGHKEIADRLSISERSSKRYLSKARQWLLNKIKMNHVKVKQYG